MKFCTIWGANATARSKISWGLAFDGLKAFVQNCRRQTEKFENRLPGRNHTHPSGSFEPVPPLVVKSRFSATESAEWDRGNTSKFESGVRTCPSERARQYLRSNQSRRGERPMPGTHRLANAERRMPARNRSMTPAPA